MSSIHLFNTVSQECSRILTQRYSTSFSFAIQLLDSDMRDPIRSIYGFVRVADEIVDTFHEFDKEALLTQFRTDTHVAIHQRASVNPILQSFQRVVNSYGIPIDLVEAFFRSMYTDLDKNAWTSAQELQEYIYGSAEVVGLMCLHVFCEGDTEKISELSPSAKALGAAFQKVNFLRDLQSDLQHLNRQYFPNVDFSSFNASSKQAIEEDIAQDFRMALDGIHQLPLKARFGVLIAYRYYERLFNKIKRMSPKEVISGRIRIHNSTKVYLFAQTAVSRCRIINWHLYS